jgi:hypothetical protein
MQRFLTMVAFLAVVAAATLGYAASGDPRPANEVVSGYAPDRTTAAFRAGLGVADSSTIATITSTYPASGTTAMADFTINGKPNLDLEVVFTVAGQTCVVDALFEYESPPGTLLFTRWAGPRTLTASAKQGNGGTGFATDPGTIWDTGGATHCRLVVTTAAASGTVSLYPVSF